MGNQHYVSELESKTSQGLMAIKVGRSQSAPLKSPNEVIAHLKKHWGTNIRQEGYEKLIDLLQEPFPPIYLPDYGILITTTYK